MAKRKQPPQRYEISIESNGKTYRTDYYVESGTVTVEAMFINATVAKMTTQIGAFAELTRILLSELISAGRVRESR
jgi:hypothetical protein